MNIQVGRKICNIVSKYKSYMLLIFIPFIFVNLFDYSNNNSIIFDPMKIANILSLPLSVNIIGLEIYVSIITVLSLLVVLIQWQTNTRNQRMADINGLLEEIKHNINIIGDLFLTCDYVGLYKDISKEIDLMSKTQVYPNPSDNCEEFKYKKYITIKPDIRTTIVHIRDQFINTVVSSRILFDIEPKRIFINCGHLKYSIDRHNRNVSSSNDRNDTTDHWTAAFKYAKEEYYAWLHFRLHYMLIDLVKNVDINDIIDKDYYRKVKRMLQ